MQVADDGSRRQQGPSTTVAGIECDWLRASASPLAVSEGMTSLTGHLILALALSFDQVIFIIPTCSPLCCLLR
jgi:hypothetical protein